MHVRPDRVLNAPGVTATRAGRGVQLGLDIGQVGEQRIAAAAQRGRAEPCGIAAGDMARGRRQVGKHATATRHARGNACHPRATEGVEHRLAGLGVVLDEAGYPLRGDFGVVAVCPVKDRALTSHDLATIR